MSSFTQRAAGCPQRPARTRSMVSLWAIACFAVSNTWASDSSLDRKVTFHIVAQPLDSALVEFSRQAGIPVAVAGPSIHQIRAPEISGTMASGAALTELLDSSGLRYESDGGAVTVIPTSTRSGQTEQSIRLADNGPEVGGGGQGPATEAGDSTGPISSSATDKSGLASKARSESRPLEEVLVTGSRLSQPATDGPRPVSVYSKTEIDQSGQSNIGDFLNTLSVASVSVSQNPNQTQNGYSTVRLHGLPTGTTLVLLNGRRMESFGWTSGLGSYVDLNTIPSAAVESIEILPEGSSAIYGSDALAGVVNVIMKKDWTGLEADAHYGFASGTSETSQSLALGKGFEDGSFTITGSHYIRSALDPSERAISSQSNFQSIGGPDFSRTTCGDGNVYSTTGANLPGLAASQSAIPRTVNGMPTLQQFQTAPPGLNRCNALNNGLTLINPTERESVYGQGSYRGLGFAEIFAEVLYTQVKSDTSFNLATLSKAVLPASNPFNPFGQSVLIDYQFPDAGYHTSDHTSFLQSLIGARGAISDSWSWEVTASFGRDRETDIGYDQNLNTGSLNAALGSTDPTAAFNPFNSTQPISSQLLGSLFSPPSHLSASGQAATVGALLRGKVIPGLSYSPEVAVGGEFRHEEQSPAQLETSSPTRYERRYRSAYGEGRVPLLLRQDSNADVLALSGAVRYDHSDDFGAHTTPEAGIEFRPMSQLLLRASYAESYRAPALGPLHAPKINYGPIMTVVDPLRNNTVTTGVDFIYGGNPDLRPETGKSKTVGLTWVGHDPHNVSISLTYFSVEMDDRISIPAFATLLGNAQLFPGRVIRGAPVGGEPGVVLGVDDSYANFGTLTTDGIDSHVSADFSTPIGTFAPEVNFTWTGKYEAAVTESSVPTDSLSRANTDAWSPRWKGNGAMGWSLGQVETKFIARYVSSYLDYNSPTRELGNFWLFDLTANWAIGQQLKHASSYLDGMYISGGVINLTNSLPVFASFNPGTTNYDPSQYDIRGRFSYINIGIRF